MGTLEKILKTSLGAALMTEEGVREALGSIKLPREAKAYLARQAKQRKEDIVKILASEFAAFLQRINIHEEIRKALQGLTIEINIKREKP